MASAGKNKSKDFDYPLVMLIQTSAAQGIRRLKAVREQSRLLTFLIGCFIIGYLVLSFWLFYRGLRFVGSFPGLGVVLTERLLYLLFAFLFVLLLLSNIISSYTNLFRNRESNFLMSLPIPAQTIFRWKFIESTLLASWAFLFLIAPLLAAYGITRDVDWRFYPVTLLLICLFIILPGVLGSWMAVNLARFLDRRSFQIGSLLMAVGGVVFVAIWWRSQPISDDMLETRVLPVLDQLLQKTRFAQFAFLPSYWLSSAVLQWADGGVAMAGFFALVLLSNVLLFGFLSFTSSGPSYYDAFSKVQSRASVWGHWAWFKASQKRKRSFHFPIGFAERMVECFWWLDNDCKALLVKDARMFWRDTTQWGQTVLLFGLLGVYVLNVRHFTSQLTNPFWIHLISYLNLGACSLNLATLTTRFVYPQFSLEGRRLWIVGMAPMGLARVVKVKYWLASCASLGITLTLVTVSSRLLHLEYDRILFFAAVVTIMTFSLNGLASGLGVLYPNFKESNPSKIVSGFGGTFCLVLSFIYILGSVLALAFGSAEMRNHAASPFWAMISVGFFFLLSLVIGVVPFQLGLRQLRKAEY